MKTTFRAILMKSTAGGAWHRLIEDDRILASVRAGYRVQTIAEPIETRDGRFLDVVVMDAPEGVRRATADDRRRSQMAYSGHDVDKAVAAMTDGAGQ